MSARPLLLCLGIGLLCGCLWYDFREVARYRQQRAATRAAMDTFRQVASELRALSGAPASSEAAGASTGGRSAVAGPSHGAGGPPSAASTSTPIGARLIISRDPELSARYMSAYAASIDAKFGLEFRRLGLSAQDEAQLRSVLVDIEAQKLKLAQMAADQGVAANDPSLKSAKQDLLQGDVASLKQLLSPDQLHSLEQFGSDGSLVDRIQEFSGNAAAQNVTPDQAAALLPILESASEHDSNGEVISHTINIQEASSAAASVLSQDQLAVFTAVLRKDEAERQIDKASAGKSGQ